MRCLGIIIKKNEIWYSVIDGNKKHESIISNTGKQNYRSESQRLMMDFYNIFIELVNKFRPDRVSYKLYLDANIKQIPYMHYSLGILNLICQQEGIKTTQRSNVWITAGGKSKIERCEQFFLTNKLKKEELEASVVAWYELEE